MWAKRYLIQPILSCHINLYKINLYKNLWLYYYSIDNTPLGRVQGLDTHQVAEGNNVRVALFFFSNLTKAVIL